MTPLIIAQSTDSWREYDGYESHHHGKGKGHEEHGKGKGKGHDDDYPVVPEPSFYGLILVGLCLLLMLWVRRNRKD